MIRLLTLLLLYGLLLASALTALAEGAFYRKRVQMGFLNHGGMWSDFLVLAPACVYVSPFLKWSLRLVGLASGLAIILTWVVHEAWAKIFLSRSWSGHIFPDPRYGNWRDISKSGWFHAVGMVAFLTIVLLSFFSGVPRQSALLFRLALTVHVLLACVLPDRFCRSSWKAMEMYLIPLLIIVAIWTLGAVLGH